MFGVPQYGYLSEYVEGLVDQGTSIASNHFTNFPMTSSLHCTGEYEPEFTVDSNLLGGTPEASAIPL